MFSTELWLTPLILLPGVALLIMSTAARFGQLQEELHHLLSHPDRQARIMCHGLVKRAAYYRNALASLYTGVGLFSLGSLLGGVVNLWQPEALWVVGGLTILGIGCIVYASSQLLRESMLSLQIIEEQRQRIENSTCTIAANADTPRPSPARKFAQGL